jgi:DnaJ like chaperone protein
MEYHPDRVAHLGQELKDLAAKKTTEINAAFAAIRRTRTT